nr:immunoglobulin heavy chain junction region [Mus musculus]
YFCARGRTYGNYFD